MTTAALSLSLLLSSPICYHAGIFYPGGSDAVCKDEGTMTGGQRAAILSLGLVGAAWTMGDRVPRIDARLVETRLTGIGAYVPCRTDKNATDLIPDTVCDGSRRRPARQEREDPPADRATRGAGAVVEEKDQEIPQSEIRADGPTEKLNRVIRQYERQVIADPHNATGWSNLAAAYSTRAQKTEDPRDLLRSYEAASRAVEENGDLLEGRFNQAVALERLFLLDAARIAWQDYEARDKTSSDWVKDARKRQRDLAQSGAGGVWKEQEERLWRAALQGEPGEVRAIVNFYRQAAREYAEQRLFGDWGEAVLAGREQAAKNRLDVLRIVGNALARTSGERLVQDSVATIDTAERAGDFQRFNEIARGAYDFREGYKAYKDRQTTPAKSKLTAAQEALSRNHCALAWRAAFYLVSNDYVARKYPAALAGAERLAEEIKAEQLPYGALRAHIYWIKGMAELTLVKPQESIADLRESFERFKLLGERENAANIDCRLGEVLMYWGRRNEAWRHIYRALRSIPELRDPDQISMVYMVAGNAALQGGFKDAALAFQEGRVRQTRLNKENILAQVEALTWLARFQHHQGDDAGAQASLQEARRLVGKAEAKQRPRREADLAMIQGMILEESDPNAATTLLNAALPVYENEKNVVFRLWTHLARGRAYRQAKNDDAAERDFESALNLYSKMGETLVTEDLRLALLEETDGVFDELVDLQADREDPERAFAYADRARPLVLPGSASKLWTGLSDETSRLLASEPQPLPLDEIRRRLPEGVTVVQFSVLQDRVLIRPLRRNGKGEEFFQQPIPRRDLEEQVARLPAFGSPGWDETSKKLFDLLIQPWLSSVPAGDRIIFVPDKVLHRVPFAALKSLKGFLMETHSLAIAPSTTLYINALERKNPKPLNLARGLVVGEPTIDRNVAENKRLSLLPAAKKEAENLATQRNAKLLVGEGADKASFLAAAPLAEWIQFSGHAVIDPANTLLSKLVLAGKDGALTAREIYALKLSNTRLIVLAACDTGNEYLPGGEGATSLARAFLAAGVPTVVASLWSVDDEATAHLFEAFHRHYPMTGDPVEALRAAQLEMLRSPNERDRSPSTWAAFVVIGASADDQP